MTNQEIENIFIYHPPTVDQAETYRRITQEFILLAWNLNELLPDGPGKTVAIRKLSEARMQANATVALEGKF